jgi:hypothetical protein
LPATPVDAAPLVAIPALPELPTPGSSFAWSGVTPLFAADEQLALVSNAAAHSRLIKGMLLWLVARRANGPSKF